MATPVSSSASDPTPKAKTSLPVGLAAFMLVASAAPAATYIESYAADEGAYLAEWGVVGDRIDFRLTVTTPGWVAVGFSDNQQMPLTDVIMATVEGNVPSVQDSWAAGYSAPPADTIDDVSLGGGSETAGTTVVEFSRLLDTGDAADDYALDTPRYLLWAYNSFSDSFSSYHSANRGFSPEPIRFSDAVVPEPTPGSLLAACLAGAALLRRSRPRPGRFPAAEA